MFLCPPPRLMTFAWQKNADENLWLSFWTALSARHFWPASEHKPFRIGLFLQFSSCSPWQVKRAGGILELKGVCGKCGRLKTKMKGLFCTNLWQPTTVGRHVKEYGVDHVTPHQRRWNFIENWWQLFSVTCVCVHELARKKPWSSRWVTDGMY